MVGYVDDVDKMLMTFLRTVHGHNITMKPENPKDARVLLDKALEYVCEYVCKDGRLLDYLNQ
jgi:hypothetical protein